MLHKKDFQGIAKTLGLRLAVQKRTFPEAMASIEDVANTLKGTNPRYNAKLFVEFAKQSFLASRRQVTFINKVKEDVIMQRDM